MTSLIVEGSIVLPHGDRVSVRRDGARDWTDLHGPLTLAVTHIRDGELDGILSDGGHVTVRADEWQPTFKARHREMQEIVRELLWLRAHNTQFTADDPQDSLLLMSEGALVLIGLERFLRIVLAGNVGPKDTLPTLLKTATGKKLGLLTLPDPPGRDAAIDAIRNVRNALMHANYEQAATQSGCADIREYFQTRFAPEIETLWVILDSLMTQIDPVTGKRVDSGPR